MPNYAESTMILVFVLRYFPVEFAKRVFLLLGSVSLLEFLTCIFKIVITYLKLIKIKKIIL